MSSTLRIRAFPFHGAFVLALLPALLAEPASAQSAWLQTAAGTYSWQTGANWSTGPTVPGGVDAVANLTNDIAGDQVVTLDAAVTLGTLGIGDASGTSSFTLAAGTGGPLTFDVSTGSAAITKTTGGADTIATPITLADALSVTVSTGTLTLSGNIGGSVTSNVTKLGGGRLVLSGTNNYSGATTVRAGTLDLTGGQITNTQNNNKALNLASTSGDVATMNVSGGSIVFGTSAGLMIGERGTGTYNQTGGTVTVGGVVLGDNTGTNSQGTANLTGGSFTSVGNVVVANRTTGTFNVSGTADVTIATLQFGSGSGGNSGTFNLDGGTVRLNGVTRTAGTARFSFNGGTLVARQNNASFFTGTMTAEIKAGGAIIDTGAFAVTIGQSLVEAASSPGGGLTKRGTGSLTLSGVNTYTGTTSVNAGTLVASSSSSLPGFGTSGRVVFDGGTLQIPVDGTAWTMADADTMLTNATKSSGALAIDVATGTQTQTGSGYSGGIGLTKLGTGTLTLSGSNTYTGTTSINAGTLQLGGSNALAGGGSLTFGGGSLQYTASNTVDYAARIRSSSSAISIDTNSQAVTLAGGIDSTNTGGLTKLGTGTLTLSGANTYSGTTTASAGTIVIAHNLALRNSVLDTTGAGEVILGSGITTPTIGGITGLTDLATELGNYAQVTAINLNPVAGRTATYSGTIADGVAGMSLTMTGAGTQILSGTNTYTGITSANAGALVASTTAALPGFGTPAIVFNGGILGASVGGSGWTTAHVDTLLATATKTSGALGIDTTNGDVTQWTAFTTSPTSFGPSLGLAKLGTGTLTLTASNSYAGPTFVNGGTLQLPTTATLSFSGGLDVAPGAQLTLGATSSVVGFTSLAGAGTVAMSGGANGTSPGAFVATQLVPSTFSGYLGTAFNLSAQFVKSGPAALTVTGSVQTMGTTASAAGVGGGAYRLTAGELILSGAGGALVRGSDQGATGRDARLYLSNGASLTLDNSTLNNNDRLPNSGNKSSGNAQFSGATFTYLGNSSVDSSETYGGGNDTSGTDFGAGQSVYSVTAGAGRKATVTSTKGFTRSAGGTALFRGTNLGDGTRSTILAGVAAPPTLTGGTGSTSSTTATNIAILPWAVGDTSATGSGAGLVTYDATLGIRPLATTNYASYAGSADITDNVRLAAATTLADSKTVNALLVDAGGGGVTVTGTGQTVTLTSGALALVGGNSVTLAGGTYAFGAAEGIVHAFADTSMSGSFTGTGGLTKAGFGTLAVSTAQSYTGVTRLSGGVLKLDLATGLPGGIGSTGGTSNLTFSGGVLGLATGNFTRGLGTGVTQVQFAGNGGFAAFGADREVNLGGSATPGTVTWNSGQFLVNTLLLGAPSADAKVTFRNPIALGANALRMIEVADGSAPVDAELSGVVSGTGVSGIIKTGPGTLLLSAASTYAGDTTVYAGRLLVNGSLTATARAAVLAGGTLGGSGSIAAAITGAGTVSPGNSPGILTATQFDGAVGLDSVFEFTGASPTWSAATASVNDVLRLTNTTTPFTAALGGGNRVDILFDIAGLPGAVPVAQGTYTGGFFTDVQSDFLSSLSLGDFRYWVRGTFGGTQQSFDGVVYSPLSAFDPSLSVTLGTVPVTAGFSGGSIDGQSMQLVVVPEPGGLLVAGVGIVVVGAGLTRGRRRLMARRLA